MADDEVLLTANIVSLACEYGRYGYRRITALLKHGIPKHIRSDNGPEFVAKAVRSWLSRRGVETLFIERGSPWENGYIESFNGYLRDGLLDGEIFTTLQEARVLTQMGRQQFNHIRPHSALGYRPPAPEAVTHPPIATAS